MWKEMRSLYNHKWRKEEKEEMKKRRNEEKEVCNVHGVILLKKITKQWEKYFISQWISLLDEYNW